MKRLILLLISGFLLLSVELKSQQIELFGYYEPQYMGIRIQKEYSQLFSNKLRLDLGSSVSEDITFTANINFITYHGRTDWNMLDYVPDRISAIVDHDSVYLYDYSYNDSIFLDNVYLKFVIGKFDLTLGKQQVSPGTGYAWNPTDLFNFKNLVDPTYEQPGHNGIRLDFAISLRHSLSLVTFPEDNLGRSGKFVCFDGKISHFDYSLVYIEKQWLTSDYITYQQTESKRKLYGGDFAGELLGLGVWGETGYNTFEDYCNFWETLIGLDYTFDNGTYLMMEYYRNDNASSNYNNYDLNDWMSYFMAESRSVSRDNMYIYINYPLSSLLYLENSFIMSLSDKSIGIVPGLKGNLYENIEMNIFANYNLGNEKKAYSNKQGVSGIIRLRAYF